LIPGGVKEKKDKLKLLDWHNFSKFNLRIAPPAKGPDFIVGSPPRLMSPPPVINR